MQLTLPLQSPHDLAPRALFVGGRTYDVHIVRHRRARRYLLRVRQDGALRLTVPRGAAIADGLRFVKGQVRWIERERARQQRRAAPWRDGSTVLCHGREERLRAAGTDVWCGDARIATVGPLTDLRGPVEAYFRALATEELPARCLQLAALHGLAVARVLVRNQKSRWGSCSPGRTIALNWRLIQMPPRVSDYIVFHELMHLRQANHSRRFWREVASVCSDWRECEQWLRKHGKEIL